MITAMWGAFVVAAYVAALLAAHDSRDGRDWSPTPAC
jgi:hypothetical protein